MSCLYTILFPVCYYIFHSFQIITISKYPWKKLLDYWITLETYWLECDKLLEYLGNFFESLFINFIVSAMLFERLEELNVFLSLLFNSKLTLPSVSTLKDVICNNVTEKKSNTAVQSFIQFIDNIEKYFSDIKIVSSKLLYHFFKWCWIEQW